MKKIINHKLKSLEKTGSVKVLNFSYHKKMPQGSRGFPDYIILAREGIVVFVELKLKNDRLRPKQREFQDICRKLKLHYFLIDEKNIDEFIRFILNKLND